MSKPKKAKGAASTTALPIPYYRIKLRSFLQSRSSGRKDADAWIVPDPFDATKTLTVHDAAILGYRHVIDDVSENDLQRYVDALVGKETVAKEHMISDEEIAIAVQFLNSAQHVAQIAAAKLAAPNLPLFRKDIKETVDNERLLIALTMNTRAGVVTNGGQVCIIETRSRHSYTTSEYEKHVANEHHWFGEKKVSDYKVWFEHPARLHYRGGVTSAPLGRDHHGRPVDLTDKLNLWADLAIKPRVGEWSLLRDHMLKVLCRGNQEHFQYLLNWLAHMIQRPWEKPGVAVVVWGAKRTGKGTVADAVRELLGADLSRMSNQKDHVVGRFSISATPLLFMQVEEAIFAGNPKEEGPLKSKITDPTETIELKFKTPYEVPSYTRWWFNSNSEEPVPITADEERYFVLHVGEEHKGDHAYFSAIRQQLYHEGGLQAMMQDLSTRDLKDFQVRKQPVTLAQQQMTLARLKPDERAIADMLIEGGGERRDNAGTPIAQFTLQLSKPTWVPKDAVVAVLGQHLMEYGTKAPLKTEVTKRLKDLDVITATRQGDKNTKITEASYKFAALCEVREKLEKRWNLPAGSLCGDSGGGEDVGQQIVYHAQELRGLLVKRYDESAANQAGVHLDEIAGIVADGPAPSVRPAETPESFEARRVAWSEARTKRRRRISAGPMASEGTHTDSRGMDHLATAPHTEKIQ